MNSIIPMLPNVQCVEIWFDNLLHDSTLALTVEGFLLLSHPPTRIRELSPHTTLRKVVLSLNYGPDYESRISMWI